MLSLATLDLLLSISESELIEEMVVGLLASPQLAIFFEKFPRIKRALMKDIPGWKQNLQQRIREAKVPAGLANEFALYQQSQLEDSPLFYAHLPQIVVQLQQWHSPFATQAKTLLHTADLDTNPQTGDSFQTLFLQRWRVSLTLQTITIHHQLLDKSESNF